jgi:hypothetical protein
MKETYKTCEDCAHWRPNKRSKNGMGVCLIGMRPDILKWPCLTACQEFSDTCSTSATRDPMQPSLSSQHEDRFLAARKKIVMRRKITVADNDLDLSKRKNSVTLLEKALAPPTP